MNDYANEETDFFFFVREHHLIELERRSTLEVLYLAPIR